MSENVQLPAKEPANGDETAAGDTRIGVYTCQCGGNIGDVIRCQEVSDDLAGLPDVAVSRTDLSLCSDAGQALIEEDIKNLGVNRVVIGACAPSLHEKTFRATVARAGLNPYLYHHIGLREQNSWVHHDDPDAATKKAIQLMTMGVAKARFLESLAAIELRAERHALVIGGGVAGLRAAYDIARRGIHATIVEKSPFLGGHMAQLEAVFPSGAMARDELSGLIKAVTTHPLVTIYTGAEVEAVSGYVGDYQVTVRQKPRGVTAQFKGLAAAIAVCPEEVPDPFNYALTTRKAIYQPYEGSYPPVPAIDWEHCTRCGRCQEVNGSGISLDDTPTRIELNVGAVVVATGFKPYAPREGEYGFGVLPEVITLPQMIRLMGLTPSDAGKLEWAGRPIRNVVMIHCVGSRQIEGIHAPQDDGEVNDYCSRICCTMVLHTANQLRSRFPGIHLFDVYEDMRTYGRGHELYYTQASQQMVRFLRFHNDEMPEVAVAPAGAEHPVVVRVKDYLTWGTDLEIPADLVVLAVGMMPNPVGDLVQLLKIARGKDRFLLEVHPKLRPVETSVPGVVLAGTAQGPMTIQESTAAASAAAAKVAALLGQGYVELEPFVAVVNPELCNGTGECVTVCHYEGAIKLETVNVDGYPQQRAVVSPANCAGCGCCVSACPNQAIDLQGWTLQQYEAMVDAIAADNPLNVEAIV